MQGKAHQQRQDQLDDEARDWIYIGEWSHTLARSRYSWMICSTDVSFSSLNLLHLSHPPPTHVENNRDSPPGTIDLHGLYVKEAIEKTEQAIMSAQANREGELRVIVGKGIHSPGHHAKIKPAVEGLMQK